MSLTSCRGFGYTMPSPTSLLIRIKALIRLYTQTEIARTISTTEYKPTVPHG